MRNEYHKPEKTENVSLEKSVALEHVDPFAQALCKIATADAASSRAAVEASKATKPSLHTRFVHDPAKGRA